MTCREDTDEVYRRMLARGQQSWDEQGDPEASFERFLMRPFLEQVLEELGESAAGMRALEIGCGTGPIACFLASRGMRVEGIDVSPVAVEEARRQAERRGLAVGFEVGDVGAMGVDRPPYDMVVDGHCLHCIVSDEERRRALAAVRSVLRPRGLFLVETMVSWPGMKVGERYRLDERGVLWMKAEEAEAPHRRIRSPEAVERELTDAGFDVRWRQVVDQKGDGKPRLMQVRATPAAG